MQGDHKRDAGPDKEDGKGRQNPVSQKGARGTKGTTKYWLLAAAALLLAGGLAFAWAMSGLRWDFSALGTSNYETNTLAIDERFQNLSIRSNTEDIVFAPSEDGVCAVEFYDQENRRHTASVEGGTLCIESADTRAWFEHITLFSLGTPKITVYLSETDYAALAIQGGTGSVTIPADFTFERMDVTLSTGDVRCAAAVSGPVRIETSTGDIRLNGLSAGALRLSVSTGAVEVRSVACTGDVEVTVRTGSARLADVSCKSLISGGSTGGLVLERVTAEDRVSVERSTGDVRLERCDAAELEIQTGTGSVTGSLASEKVFLAKSGTGRVEVPATVSGGTCRVTTSTGDIRLEIKR